MSRCSPVIVWSVSNRSPACLSSISQKRPRRFSEPSISSTLALSTLLCLPNDSFHHLFWTLAGGVCLHSTYSGLDLIIPLLSCRSVVGCSPDGGWDQLLFCPATIQSGTLRTNWHIWNCFTDKIHHIIEKEEAIFDNYKQRCELGDEND